MIKRIALVTLLLTTLISIFPAYAEELILEGVTAEITQHEEYCFWYTLIKQDNSSSGRGKTFDVHGLDSYSATESLTGTDQHSSYVYDIDPYTCAGIVRDPSATTVFTVMDYYAVPDVCTYSLEVFKVYAPKQYLSINGAVLASDLSGWCTLGTRTIEIPKPQPAVYKVHENEGIPQYFTLNTAIPCTESDCPLYMSHHPVTVSISIYASSRKTWGMQTVEDTHKSYVSDNSITSVVFKICKTDSGCII